MKKTTTSNEKPYLSTLGAWALAFGCAVGWGSFVMPGNTFLPIAGPIGTALGILLGALVMLVLAKNYHYLINHYPHDGGGTYTYTKECFGHDHGFLSAWFMILIYIAIIWANATALPLIARTLLGSTFQFGFHYTIAGFDVYFGEILLAVGALLLGALACMRRRLAAWTQIVMAILLFCGVVVCFVAATLRSGGASAFEPAFSADHTALGGTLTIFALAPWAYVGFESISHSAGESKFSPKRSFAIMAVAIVTAAIAYVALSLLAVTALPADAASWTDYIKNLSNYSGIASLPTFHAAHAALGNHGSVILGVAALCAIFTGIIGNYIALSRLIATMTSDGVFSGKIGKPDRNHVPSRAIWGIFGISAVLPFFGRTAISWIVDVTTVGATIAFALTSLSVIKTAKQEKNGSATVFGVIGLIVSLLFAIEFLVPNLLSVQTLSTESYFILAAWAILGFAVFYLLLRRDRERLFGHTTIAWIILLGIVIFTSSVWLLQSSDSTVDKAIDAAVGDPASVQKLLATVDNTVMLAIAVQISLIVCALIILFAIYSRIQKRERQIEVEKALAEETSRAKTSFLSNMSHEIRTPMNAIIGLDNIALRDPDLSPRTREQLEKIGASAKHLLGLINDILDMSRIESGRMVLKTEEFSFRELIDQISIMINGQCQDKGLHYECHLVGHIGDFYVGDDMKLKQVLINILGNAVKFTEPPGSVSLTVEEISTDGDQCTLRFTMRDTGIGMDKEYIPKIFEAFSQEDATTTNKYGGSGLGMAITKNFVEMMNGNIEVDSEKGVGSTFTVTVHLRSSSRTHRTDAGFSLPDGMRALVVDDDEIACEHAKITLQTIGVSQVETAVSAQNALERMREAHGAGDPYQLLLTDYKMPDMNGVELTRAVRSFDYGETAIILLTGYNLDVDDGEIKDAGVDDVLAKPLFTDHLMRSVQAVLERKKGTVSETAPAEESAQSGLAGHRILMAEDMDANAEILADLLELEGMDSERAENGQAALDAFSAKPAGYYDAILMDVRMPVMDGLSATEAIRSLDREDAKTIPIIAMTANVFDEDVERSLAAGMNAHLFKPIEPDRLYETLARLITKRENP